MLVLLFIIQFWPLCAHLAYPCPKCSFSPFPWGDRVFYTLYGSRFSLGSEIFLRNIRLLHQQYRLTTLWVPTYKYHHINRIKMSYVNKVYKKTNTFKPSELLVRIPIFLTSTFLQRKRNLESHGYEPYTQILWIYFHINQFLF